MNRRAYGVKRNDEDNDGNNDDGDHNNNILRFADVRTNRQRGLVTHTNQSHERFQ